MKYLKRALEEEILRVSKSYPVVLVTGPRQVGKTTMLRKIAEDGRNYVSLDDMFIRQLAKDDPKLFLQRYKAPLIIDEIQYAPELLSYIKIIVDESEERGLYWITGSQMFHLMKNVSESLAGRVAVFNMYGLSNSEISQSKSSAYETEFDTLLKKMVSSSKQSLTDVFERIFRGSMPAVNSMEIDDVEMYYSSYVTTYLERDIRDLTQVGSLTDFLRFIQVCASRTGTLVNYSEIAKEVGITSATAKNWMSLLISSGIVIHLQPYFNNALKRAVKSPKMYFMDTGLCAYLARWTSPEALEVSAMAGEFFETYVISEIVKTYVNSGKKPPLYFYRDSNGKEIDLIIEKNNTLYPIEIKKSSSPKKSAIKNFPVLEKTSSQIGQGNVVCLSDDLLPIDDKNHIVPVWLI